MSEMLTLDQVAAQLQVDERTVRHWCSQGDLQYVKFGRRILRFKPEWIEDLIHRKQGRTHEPVDRRHRQAV